MKKVLKIVLILVITIAVIVGVIFGGLYVNNKNKLKAEKSEIIEYGQKVKVSGKNMQVYMQGEGDQTFVLLPGYLTGSPKIDFELLINELSKDARVVVVEPFGYGLSDDTETPRTVENMVEEIHAALASLDIDTYALVTHSIWGVYALKYINTYPNEVTMHVGIDSSLPAQGGADENQESTIAFLAKSGIYRFMADSSDDFLLIPSTDEATKKQFKYISLKNIGSSATVNEGKEMQNNFDKTINLKYPSDLPVLYILASESVDPDPNWIPIHEAMLQDVNQGKLVVLEGGHYLHHTQSVEIVKQIHEFKGEVSGDN